MARTFEAYRFFYTTEHAGEKCSWPLGAVLVEKGDGTGFANISFRDDLRNLLKLDPNADLHFITALEKDIRKQLSSTAAECLDRPEPSSRRQWILTRIREDFSNCIVVSEALEIKTEKPEEALEQLARGKELETA